MADEKKVIEFVTADMGGYTMEEATCTNCIEGFCPARTPSSLEGVAFTFCGARKNADGIVAAYSKRTGVELHIEKPC